MSMWTGIVFIVALVVFAETWRAHIKAKASDDSSSRQSLDELNERMTAMETELRERIETLERIVTDDKADLKRQFDYLDKAS